MSDEGATDEQFALKLSGNGVTIERRVSSYIAAKITSLVLGGPAANSSEPSSREINKAEAGPKLSLREYLDEVGATKKHDQIVAIGQFMADHEQSPSFSRDDIKAKFSLAKEPMPANFPRDFGVAVKTGMIASHQQKGLYYVTKTGARAVEARFSSALKRAKGA